MQFVQHSSGKTSKVIDMDKDTSAMVVTWCVGTYNILYTVNSFISSYTYSTLTLSEVLY